MTDFPANLVPAALEYAGQAEAFAEGKRMRKDYVVELGKTDGIKRAQDLANALFRDGRNDSLSVQAEVGAIKAKFPETWKRLAGGLDPENRSENGDLRHPQS